MTHGSTRTARLPRTIVPLLGALCAGGLIVSVSACSPSPAPPSREAPASGGADGGQRVPYWVEGVTPEAVAGKLHVTIPPGATDRRAAHQRGFQDDGLLLAFTLPKADTGRFVGELAPETPLSHRREPLPSAGDAVPTTPFAHLGLEEPEALADVTEGPVCGPCRGDLNSLSVAVHPLDAQRDRVYVRGVD
ncbi:hypothetical protein LUX01_01795 [Streptomyces sudanensis]|uniref:hypothetical protein n=1 Tax=Streptomyces sudanensis TaxID=436397 RepID=UPI0020CB835F|nr:hypothetical protein [Streptomyces sudanensis]MCP9985620.1 hypothetical protein [Streptomyces sudanensis]